MQKIQPSRSTLPVKPPQGQYFNELDLAHIARELDVLEREVLGGAALAEGEHGNLDDSGMFSSQVIAAGCDQRWTDE